MGEVQKTKEIVSIDPMVSYTPEEIKAAAQIVIEALTLRYETWRQTAINKDAKYAETLPSMDSYYRGVIEYIMSMVGL